MSPPSDERLHYAPVELSTALDDLPFSTQQAIENVRRASPDPDRVQHYLLEFQSRHSTIFRNLAGENTQRLQWLLTIFGYSHFLSEELLQHPEWIEDVSDLYRVLSVAEYRDRLLTLLARRHVSFSVTPESGRASALDLALFRRQQMLRIVLRDVLNLATLSETAEELSNLADAILHMALASVISEAGRRFGLPSCPAGLGGVAPCGFSVLALGKLGGRELNYSSDIDLMFLYTGNGETTGPDIITNKEFAKRVANRFTSLLSTYTTEGLCYRVDLRLRPEGSLGEVCISLDGARDYYAKRARDWELQMLIKARVAAGDVETGHALLEFVEPSIYSTTLDFTAVETMSATRERISEKLANKRLRPGQFDVKLTRGGIRDIEFLVQCLQRLHGGREPWVRHGGTMLALSRLLDKDLLSVTEYSRLVNAYQFLRHLEHRLQFDDDRQTHTLPTNSFELELMAKRMPASRQFSPDVSLATQLLQELNEHLENVQAIYDRIVHAQRPLSYSSRVVETPAPSVSIEPPPAASEAQLGVVSKPLLDALKQRAPGLAEQLSQRGLRRARPAFEHFLESLLTDSPALESLNSNTLLADYVMQLFETSPFLSEQLIRQPELLEEIRRVADHPQRRWSFEGLAAPLNDIAALRRFYRREMVRVQAMSICLAQPVFETLDRTSALAEFVIARAYRITLEQAIQHGQRRSTPLKPFIEPRDEMMVVALGRLGMREFDLASDADLIFIIPDSELERHKFWTRVAEHLIEILTAYTADGTILSIDTRLRPNGREGPLVQTESSYTEYFAKKGEAWEGIAYMKARAIAGNSERALNFLSELQQVDWRRYGQGGRSKQDLRQMRLRLEREQGGASPLKAGRGGYYDPDFILMYLRLKGAGMFFKTLNTPERIDIVEKMGHLDRCDAEFLLQATTFYRALDHAIRLVTGHAEGRLPSSRVELEMVCELLNRWTPESRRFADIEAELANLTDRTRCIFERIFS
jgi:[glutamine synthetase] adenylyltransferase / [glutamine synthetase]-adenylyl-L-tyrosine phosphorylase